MVLGQTGLRLNTLRLLIIFFVLICFKVEATVQVKAIQGNPVAVCTPSDSNSNCGSAGGSGSGTVGIGTTGWTSYYASGGAALTATNSIQIIGGNVGIGTSTAAVKLAVTGAITATGAINGSNLSGTNTGDQTTVTGNAGTVTFADAGGDTTTFPALGTSATGSLAPATDAELSYNSTTNALTAGSFIGDGSALTGISAGGWTDGGTNVYTATTTDRVGIGTTTPNSLGSLEIVKQTSTHPLMVSATATGQGNYLVVRSDGNVGIGTYSPQVLLSVNKSDTSAYDPAGVGTATIGIFNADTSTTNTPASLRLGTSTSAGANSSVAIIDAVTTDHSSITGFMTFRTKNAGTLAERMRIEAAGNVGIGTSSPKGLLDINRKLVVLSGGNVGIGTWSPTNRLQVVGTVAATAFSGDGSAITGISAGGWTDGGTNVYTATTTDNVGIGTSLPAALLEVNGSGNNIFNASSGNVGIGTLVPLNTLTVNGTMVVHNASGMGWTWINGTDNTACNTTCVSGCVMGFLNATGTAVTGGTTCSDAAADECLCAGPN